MASRSRSWISTRTSNVGGDLRSRTDFWVPRRRASSSESVTVWMPPSRSLSVGLTSRFSSELPCAVATSWTPRSAAVRPLVDRRSSCIASAILGYQSLVLDSYPHSRGDLQGEFPHHQRLGGD